MPTLPHARVVQTAIVGALALMGALAFGSSPAVAQIAEADVLQDSELVLQEEAGSGAYQRYAIAIATTDGKTVMTTNRDGVAAQFTVTPSDVVTLWRTALENGLETLPAAPAADGVPDSSAFVLTYRAQQTTGGFSAVGVDTLEDMRYRTIVRAILALASRYTGVH
jgi:hypothetical protein